MFGYYSTLIESDKTGELWVRYTPYLSGGPCIEGTITFASFDVKVGAPNEEHEQAKAAALRNAKDVLLRVAA